MTAIGFSWPSTTPCFRAICSSLKLIVATTAPRASMAAWVGSSGGVRTLSPFTSSGMFTGRLLLVRLRKPHSQLERKTSPALSRSGTAQGMNLPSSTLSACA